MPTHTEILRSTADYRRCVKCDNFKHLSKFTKDKRGREGYRSYCKECCQKYMRTYNAAHPQLVESRYAWAVENKERVAGYKRKSRAKIMEYGFTAARVATLKSLFGLTPKQYMTFVRAQDGLCPGCKNTLPDDLGKQHVDHNHDTGRVRGITCGNCNRGMGLLKDNAETLRNLADYIEAHNALWNGKNRLDLPRTADDIEVHGE